MSELPERLVAALQGRYALEREIGAGGMATVYLAQDHKHDRQVALKVLKPELAAVVGAERFLAEIKTTANLQHPHILPLFDSGEADGFLYYVMPYVEGETLRDRLAREKQLPVEEAVRIATDVADALQSAHEQGVIHRDIKPENILLSRGRPLVADFGIALAVSAAGGGRLTETGLSLGTPYYMSPEQASADRDPSATSDVYSLACVLYEMLVGEPPYPGASAQAVLAKILMGNAPAPTEARASIPGNVDAAIRKALEKLPADRFQSAADFARALGDPSFQGTPVVGVSSEDRRSPWAQAVPWLLAAGAVGVALWAGFGGGFDEPAPIRHWNLTLPDSIPMIFIGETPAGLGRTSLALSPASTDLVYLGLYRGETKLFLRDLETGATRVLPGTEGAFNPFFSPDGETVAFLVGNELKKVAIAGGSAQPWSTIEAPLLIAGVWMPDRTIVVSADGCLLFSVPETGGTPTRSHSGSACPWEFSALPGTDLIVGSYLQGLTVRSISSGERFGLSFDGKTPLPGEWTNPMIADDPRILPTGHMSYITRDGIVMVVRFDPGSQEFSGVPVPLLEGVRREGHWGSAQYTFGDDGTMVYALGENALAGQLAWIDGDDQMEEIPVEPGAFGPFQISPEGSQLLAVRERNDGPRELILYDLARGTSTRVFSSNHASAFGAEWAHDEPWYVYSTRTLGLAERTIVRVWTDGSRAPDTLGTLGGASSVSPDDRWLTIDQWPEGDIWVIPVEAQEGEPVQFTDDPGLEGFSTFSPDGKWIAYMADRSGRMEVYVESFPKDGQFIPVSGSGGEEPVWSPNGRELFYRNAQQFMVVDYSVTDGVIDFGPPRVFAEGAFVNLPGRSFTVSPDGERLLVVKGTDERTTTVLSVITNWFEDVKRRVDAGNR